MHRCPVEQEKNTLIKKFLERIILDNKANKTLVGVISQLLKKQKFYKLYTTRVLRPKGQMGPLKALYLLPEIKGLFQYNPVISTTSCQGSERKNWKEKH